MKWSESISTIAEALAAFNAEVKNPVKDKTAQAGKFSYNFSDLADITTMTRPLLAKNGISVMQELISEEGMVGAKTTMLHTSGEFIEFDPCFIRHGTAAGAQEIGSAITYARRYSYLAATGLAPEAEDDDGKGAQAGKDLPDAGPQIAHKSLIEKLRELKARAGVEDDKYAEQLEHYGVTADTDLTQESALAMKRAYEEYIAKKETA